MKIERRAYDFEVRANEGTERTATGYAAKFNTPSEPLWGEWREVIAPGAFARALAKKDRDIVALWNHQPGSPIASRDAGTLTLAEDEVGLRVSISFGDSEMERYWHSKIKDGTVRKMSFGFDLGDEARGQIIDHNTQLRTLTDIENLYEVSPVTWPAYRDTELSARGSMAPADVFSQFVPAPSAEPSDSSAAQVIGVRLRLLALREKKHAA